MAELEPDTVISGQSSLSSSAVTSECVCVGNTELTIVPSNRGCLNETVHVRHVVELALGYLWLLV